MTTPNVPAGWYRDPRPDDTSGPPLVRYWDGEHWTADTRTSYRDWSKGTPEGLETEPIPSQVGEEAPAVSERLRCPSCGTRGANLQVIRDEFLFCLAEHRFTARLRDGDVIPLEEADEEVQTQRRIPPEDWYVDPKNPKRHRYWADGRWTEKTRKGGVGAPSFPGIEEASTVRLSSLRPSLAGSSVLVTTSDELHGWEIENVYGLVYGLIVTSRGPFSDTAAMVRTAVGGEVKSYVKLMNDTRHEALLRLRHAAADIGANVVLTARFETTAITDEMVEVTAYGTAAVGRRHAAA